MTRSTTKRFIPAALVAVLLVFVLLPAERAVREWWNTEAQPWVIYNTADGSPMKCDSVRVENGIWVVTNCENGQGGHFNGLIKYPFASGAFQKVD